MSIASTDLIAYGSANLPTDDASTTGGAIDAQRRPVFTQMGGNSALEVVSSSASDTTQTITVIGRDATGALKTSTATLTGTTPAALSPATTFERILSCNSSATCLGTVTLRNTSAGTTWGTIPIGELGFYALFQNSASAGTSKVRYEKIFWKNTHGTLTGTTCTVTLTADSSALIQIGLETSINGTATIANRLAVPSGPTFVDDNVAASVPGGNLAAGDKIGVWIQETLATNNSPVRSTFTTQLSVNSV